MLISLQGGDPTYGHVQYVNQSIATNNGYVQTTSSSVYIGSDHSGVYPLGGPGRPSVRIISNNFYTHGLFIVDIAHMPFGCGTWPAFWTLGPNWPNNGEIGKHLFCRFGNYRLIVFGHH
jgi:beta-glucanase (GH16 family)